MPSGVANSGTNLDGYLCVSLKNNVDGKYRAKVVHRLVALSFYSPDNGLIVNHKNGIKTDNRPEYLEYVTKQQNAQHAIDTGLVDKSKIWQIKCLGRAVLVLGKV